VTTVLHIKYDNMDKVLIGYDNVGKLHNSMIRVREGRITIDMISLLHVLSILHHDVIYMSENLSGHQTMI